jgi:hypothetical protein
VLEIKIYALLFGKKNCPVLRKGKEGNSFVIL